MYASHLDARFSLEGWFFIELSGSFLVCIYRFRLIWIMFSHRECLGKESRSYTNYAPNVQNTGHGHIKSLYFELTHSGIAGNRRRYTQVPVQHGNNFLSKSENLPFFPPPNQVICHVLCKIYSPLNPSFRSFSE